MRIAIFMLVSFLLGMAWEKLNRWEREDECPRVYLGYNCRGKGCKHDAAAWDAVQDNKDQRRNLWRG